MQKILVTILFLLSFYFIFLSKVFAEATWFPTNKLNCKVWNPQPQSDETALWSGACLNGKANGEGGLTWRFKKNGKVVLRLIEGDMTNGRRLGKVKITYENGTIYIGKLNRNGNRHGQGTLTYADGTIKKGIWKDGQYLADSDGSYGRSTSNSKIEGYKNFCLEIGFTPGTEKFGECVVEAMKKG